MSAEKPVEIGPTFHARVIPGSTRDPPYFLGPDKNALHRPASSSVSRLFLRDERLLGRLWPPRSLQIKKQADAGASLGGSSDGV